MKKMKKTGTAIPRENAKKGKATLREVARLAGVSHTAVSRAVNGLPGLSEETRERIQSIVAQTGYKPDPHLGAFFHRVRGSGRTIALLRSASSQSHGQMAANSLDARQERAILAEARRAGYHVILSSVEDDMNEDGNLICVAEGLADAVIANVCPSDAIQKLSRHVPVVSLQYGPEIAGVDAVLTDVCRGVFAQIRHLFDLGHRRISCFVPQSRIWPHRHFLMGYTAACEDFGLSMPDAYREPILFGYNEHAAAIRAYLERVLRCDTPPTAIVTYDVYAPELMRQLIERGFAIPRDVSVVGFDDSPDFHRDCPVPLTTFRQNFDNQAFHALRLLTARTPDFTIPVQSVLVEGELVVRESTARAVQRTKKTNRTKKTGEGVHS